MRRSWGRCLCIYVGLLLSLYSCVCMCAWRAFAFTQNSTRTVLSLPPSYCVCLRHKNRIFIAFQFVIVYHTNTETHAVRVIETETHRERRSDGDSYTSVWLCVRSNFLLVFSAVFSVLFSCCDVVDGGLVGVVRVLLKERTVSSDLCWGWEVLECWLMLGISNCFMAQLAEDFLNWRDFKLLLQSLKSWFFL